ncbi:MAG: DUF370 domain-containing protein [Ruminococcaceae bacterium]|jgi:hypothetical protein|nr:DUF370 domain-containing protein [Oscillospiraceae bacterium]
MFLHLGNDYIVFEKDIIAVFDFETTTVSKITREFLREAEDEEFIVNVSDDVPKSFIVTEIKGRSKVFISNIASSTLLKRLESSD